MPRTYELYLVDAFTRNPFTGNPAGVVPDAEGLTPSEMQAIAREVGASETAFVFPADGTDHHLRVRFFTPKLEVPICGHATIATHHVFAETRRKPTARKPVRLLQKTQSGIHAVEVTLFNGAPRVLMTQSVPEFSSLPAKIPCDTMLEALGIGSGDLDERYPIATAFSGEYTIFVPLKSRAALDSLKPDMTQLSQAFASYLLFTLDTGDATVLTHCRMFAPAYGVNEDPVTGMANGPLGAYLALHGAAPSGERSFRFLSRQGVALGRPGTVEVLIDHEGGKILSVQIGGQAVTIFSAKLRMG
jgi:PhzF family phenazine biosynthesis protein